jgi:hypothetical protein
MVAIALAGMLASGAAFAASPYAYEGEWTLNVEKSKYPPGFPEIKDHHMQVTKDDGASLQYTDNFTIGDQATHVSYDGAYDGKPYKTSDGQMMAYFHTKTGYRDQYTAPNGTKGKDSCSFSADGKVMTCHGQFTPPNAKEPVKFLEVWDKTK